MKILLLSRYGPLGASSRVRFYQYLPYLQAQGIEVTVVPLLGDSYLRSLYWGGQKPLRFIMGAYLQRFYTLLKSHHFHLLWIEYEIFPWLPALAEMILGLFNIPYVVDYDDAIFHRYDMHPNSVLRSFLGNKIDGVMHRAALVIVGNDYLADRASRAGAKRLEILPSVVDLSRYERVPKTERGIFTIGWIGTPITAQYLHSIEASLSEVCRNGRARLVLVGSGSVVLKDIPLEVRTWTEESEVADIQSFDVGIMPVADDVWSRGKCGYKLIQYMACGLPSVASPVGANQKIIEDGVNGFLAKTKEDWGRALSKLLESKDLGESMGRAAREKVEREYSLQVTAPRLISLLRSVAKGPL